MPRLLQVKSYTLNMKVALALLVLSIFLLSVLFLMIVPKMQKEQYEQTKKRIEQMIAVTKEQVKVAGKAIEIQGILEKSETKYKLVLDLLELKKNHTNIKNLIKNIQKTNIVNHCYYLLKNKDIVNTNIKDKLFLEAIKKAKEDTWTNHKFLNKHYSLKRKVNYALYKTKINKNTDISILCEEYKLNKNHASFEEGIKVNVQKTFALTHKFHKGKTYLMWINDEYLQENDRPLYEEDKKKRKERYSISNMSNVKNIFTGDLTAKQINNAKNKEPLIHNLNNKKAHTWIEDLSDKGDKYTFLLVTTIYEDDLYTHGDSTFWKILPASLTALFLSIVAGFFLFKRLFKGINILSDTAKEVNKGNKNIRSKVKGNDDIGHLGIVFDSMLDSLQQNIKTLDSKVENKTKELQNSLEEKEVLLKEIHHRVKNNLAMTIGLIKLQEVEIEDKNTKKILNNIQERIYTMELLHRKLYESSKLNEISFKEYVTNLVYDIETTYNYDKKIDVNIDIKDIYLNIETAMPCGLIINEVITNAFKYAFKNNDNPKLLIKMEKTDNTYTLIIKDNGEGIDESIDIYNSDSLGLKLINTISKLQLQGTLKYSYENGAKFIIEF